MTKRLKTEIVYIKEESEVVDIKEEYTEEVDPLKVDWDTLAKGKIASCIYS